MSLISTESVIWEQCIKEERCIKIGWPINKKYCISISACIRILSQNGKIFLELQAFGRNFRYELSNACHTFFTTGIATFRICVSPNGKSSVRIVIQGCIGIDGVKECWTLFAAYPRWFNLQDATADELRAVGIDAKQLVALTDNKLTDSFGVVDAEMSAPEIDAVLKSPNI